ncbi:hypothetical protein E5Q10_08710 [Streptococcus pneumoniae]|nr:hypothetical protein EZ481_07600 [Streptococcus pneumoniae]QEL28977.1 hypothetical protein E5Q10_08710 [Streptococcus pneumoniae]UKP24787.1 hypothetical protein EQH42_08750 [Streptococcus pneumoniae]
MSCFVAFHYRSYGTFFLHKNKLHNIHRGFTHYKYYRAQFRLGFFDVRMTECHLKWKERENFHDFLKFYCKDS